MIGRKWVDHDEGVGIMPEVERRASPSLRRIVVGVGHDGESRVIESAPPRVVYRFRPPRGGVDSHTLEGRAPTGDVSSPAPGEVTIAELWATGSLADGRGGDPTLAFDGFDVETPPGATRWRVVTMGAGWQAAMHKTNTIDYDVVLAGDLELVLEDGAVSLAPGDVVVLPGVVHGWRAGPHGASMAVTMLGQPDSTSDETVA